MQENIEELVIYESVEKVHNPQDENIDFYDKIKQKAIEETKKVQEDDLFEIQEVDLSNQENSFESEPAFLVDIIIKEGVIK